MGDVAVEVALHIRAERAERPLWDAPTARLWWVDITGQRVRCYDPESGADCSWPVSGPPGGVVLDTDGHPVIAMPDGLAVLDRASGSTELLMSRGLHLPRRRRHR
jgi:L-arabinonolactonase